MQTMRHFYLLLFAIMPFLSLAQVKITGQVINATDTKPVSAASVFLSNTTNGNETAENGRFTLYNIKPGKYDLVVSIIGFEAYTQSIIVGSSDISLPPIALFSNAIALKEVKIKPDNSWKRLYRQFIADFLGTSSYASDCVVKDPYILDLSYDADKRQLTAKTYTFLVIENNALGYRIKYLLNSFVKDYNQQAIAYQGYTLFEELKGTPADQLKWDKNRLDCYNGSTMHFLRSILADQMTAENFEVRKLVRTPDLAYNPKKDGPDNKYHQRLVDSATLGASDFVKRTDQKTIFALSYPWCLYVTYTKKTDYSRRPIADQFNMPNYATSIVTIPSGTSLFYTNGVLVDPATVVFEGYWAGLRVAQQLPVDYEPALKKQ